MIMLNPVRRDFLNRTLTEKYRVMKKEMSGLSARELEILGILGFDFGGQKSAKKFIADTIQLKTKRQLHDKGLSLRSLEKIATKFGISLPKPVSKKTSQEEIDEEVREMLSYVSD